MGRSVKQGVRRQRLRGVSLWSDRLQLDARLADVVKSLDIPEGKQIEVLKRSGRRSVVRLHGCQGGYESLIVKGFPLNKIESRIKYRQYGLGEAEHYLALEDHDIRVPEYYGYFEHRVLGTVKSNGVLIQDLVGHVSLHDKARRQPQSRLDIYCEAIEVLAQLYERGVYHIDATAHNLLQSPTGELVLIDWQYCSFPAPRNPLQLMLQGAQFLRYTDLTPDMPDWSSWLEQLYTACEPHFDWPWFRDNVAQLQARRRPSPQARMALQVPIPIPPS